MTALALLVQSVQHMYASARRRRPALLAFARLMPVVIVATLAVRASPPAQRASTTSATRYFSWCLPPRDNPQRAAVRQHFRNLPGRHLVIVRYGSKRSFMDELVYNDADIDAAQVVWARDLGEAANEKLIRYYHGRRAWILDAGTELMGIQQCE